MPAGVANAGLINFTKALGDELVRDGILVNGVSPCPMNTRRLDYMVKAKAAMSNISEDAAREAFLRDIPIGISRRNASRAASSEMFDIAAFALTM